MAMSWSMVTVSLDYSDIRGVITQGGGIVTTTAVQQSVKNVRSAGVHTTYIDLSIFLGLRQEGSIPIEVSGAS